MEYSSQLASKSVLHGAMGRSITPGKSGKILVLVEWELISPFERVLTVLIFLDEEEVGE